MRALLCRTLTGIDDLRVEEVEAPKPAAGEVLIDVAAAGVNFPDVLLTQGKYQFKAPLPFPPALRSSASCSGTISCSGRSAITTAAAWIELLRMIPSRPWATSMIFFASGSAS